MHENSYLEECIQMLERKLNQGPYGQWTASDFSVLSQQIFDATGKTVSDSTLKRIFGKKDAGENYTPQLYTRNALAEYLGFKDWQQFKNELKAEGPAAHQIKKKYPLGLTGILILCTVVLAVIIYFTGVIGGGEKVWLKAERTSQTVPITTVFHYDVSEVKDSVFIDFGNNTPVPLPKDKHKITEYYKAAGIFFPRILTRKKVLDSVRIVNFSAGWQGGYSPNDDYRMFIPFEDSAVFRQDDRLYIAPSDLKIPDPLYNKGIYAEYRLMRDFNVSLDNLEFSATVKNSPHEGGKLCYDVEIWLIGSEDNCKVRFVEPGCFRYGQLKISEKVFSGRYDDLSALARDLKNWTTISIKLESKLVIIQYNSSDIVKQEYQKNLGKLQGFYFRYYGTGSLSDVSIRSSRENTLIFKSNF